jgi:hypothetical protein
VNIEITRELENVQELLALHTLAAVAAEKAGDDVAAQVRWHMVTHYADRQMHLRYCAQLHSRPVPHRYLLPGLSGL